LRRRRHKTLWGEWQVKNPGLWELPLELLCGNHRKYMPAVCRMDINSEVLYQEVLQPFPDRKPFGYQNGFRFGKSCWQPLRTGTILFSMTKPVVAFIHNLIKFFAEESCGCVLLAAKTSMGRKNINIFRRRESPDARHGTTRVSYQIFRSGNTFCAHAPGAAEPLESDLNIP